MHVYDGYEQIQNIFHHWFLFVYGMTLLILLIWFIVIWSIEML